MTNPVTLVIPEGVRFDALHLSRNTSTGDVSFDWNPIQQICAASGIEVSLLRDQPEDNVAGLLVAWYEQDRVHGCEINAVMEELLAETKVEVAIDAAAARGEWTP